MKTLTHSFFFFNAKAKLPEFQEKVHFGTKLYLK